MSDNWWEKVLRFIGFEEIEQPRNPGEFEREAVDEAYADGYTANTRRQPKWASTNGESKADDSKDRKSASSRSDSSREGSLVSLPGGSGSRFRLIVVHPQKFDEVQYIANHLKERRPVILNLEGIAKDEAQKLVNFLSGAIFALDGEMQHIGSSILLFTPVDVEVSSDDVRKELDGLP